MATSAALLISTISLGSEPKSIPTLHTYCSRINPSMPTDPRALPPTLRLPAVQPWYATYYFRFEAVRDNGDRLTNHTHLDGARREDCEKQLAALLGPGRYTIAFLGMTEIPFPKWPVASLIECGVDREGRRCEKRKDAPVMPATPVKLTAAKDDPESPPRPRRPEIKA